MFKEIATIIQYIQIDIYKTIRIKLYICMDIGDRVGACKYNGDQIFVTFRLNQIAILF